MGQRHFESVVMREGLEESIKEVMLQAYWEGYQLGQGVEDTSDIDRRMAEAHFGRWYDRNKDW